MGASAALLSATGVLATLVAIMVDGRRAVAIAVVFLAAGLAPTAATFGGAPGVAVLSGCAVAAVLLAWIGWLGGRVLPWLSGLDPMIEEALSSIPEVEVYLFEPGGAPSAKEMVNRSRRPKLTKAKAALGPDYDVCGRDGVHPQRLRDC